MTNLVLKKWIEPYVLLETLKSHYEMKDFTFDGWTKPDMTKEFFRALKKQATLGLYMKNVNKFYVFSGVEQLNLKDLFNFNDDDLISETDANTALQLVDMGKAEAAFIQL